MKRFLMAFFLIVFSGTLLSDSRIVSMLESDTHSLKVDIGTVQKKADKFKDS